MQRGDLQRPGRLGYSLDPSDFNVASIAIGDLAGVQTVTRKVTNVGAATATYTASVTGMAGFTVVVSPASLTLRTGRNQERSRSPSPARRQR